MVHGIDRELLPDGAVRIASGETAFAFARPKNDVLVVTITGYDKGQLGTAPFDEIDSVLRVAAPLQLFVDARAAVGATVRVSRDWTNFLSRHRSELEHVHVLAASRAVELTVAIARHLSRTDGLIDVHSDPAIFESKLASACKRSRQ
jgi:hypothetical protein